MIYTSKLAHRIFNFIDYAVRISLKPYVPGAKTSALRIFHFLHIYSNKIINEA